MHPPPLIGYLLAKMLQAVRHVRVTVHRGYLGDTPEQMVFINVTNLSPSRDIEVIRVWFATAPSIEVSNPHRPLPKRLRIDESWETWTTLGNFSPLDVPYAETLGRVELSSGKVFRSIARKTVASHGPVPGGT